MSATDSMNELVNLTEIEIPQPIFETWCGGRLISENKMLFHTARRLGPDLQVSRLQVMTAISVIEREVARLREAQHVLKVLLEPKKDDNQARPDLEEC